MQPLGSLEGTKDFESGGNGANTLPGGGRGLEFIYGSRRARSPVVVMASDQW